MNVCRQPLGSQLIELLESQSRTLAGAESCTGGGVSASITAVPGASQVFCGGKTLLELLRAQNRLLAGAESCTGGMVSAAITAVPGSSDVFCGGVVSYTNEIKRKVLGVSAEVLQNFGAVSEECTAQMAEGVAKLCGADTAYSVSGIAGPGGGTAQKPVGTVCFGFYNRGKTTTATRRFLGDRADVRRQASLFVVETLVSMLGE